MSIESVIPFNHLILCHPLLHLPSIFPRIRAFSNDSALCIRWPKYWSFSFNTGPSKEYSGLIFLRLTGFICLQFKGLWRVFSSSRIQKHQFFCAQLSYGPTLISIHDYWKNYMDLCRQSDVSPFYMLSRLVTGFLPRSKSLWISWLQSPSAVILKPKEIKSVTVSTFYPSYLP